MLTFKLIAEGIGLGFLLYLICAVGIRNGAVGIVHLYDPKVRERVVHRAGAEGHRRVYGTGGKWSRKNREVNFTLRAANASMKKTLADAAF